ncbi:MAG TPA: Stp1/IreP family PP2C-type Ser/Thr phosphatase [Pyrinomonadaceae bacterium]|nr:Stp1/IreP family PP2C-type Ser/Thr phosphatase [Pyrinomonadaceae bacterium]
MKLPTPIKNFRSKRTGDEQQQATTQPRSQPPTTAEFARAGKPEKAGAESNGKNENRGTMKKAVKATGSLKAESAYEIIASVQTDKGCVREINEDSGRFVSPNDPAILRAKGILLIVADGMGGHSAGEVASGMAVELVPRLYYGAKGKPQTALKRAVEEANRRINSAAAADAAKHGMGTTCTTLAILDGQAFAAHVGDSRLYMQREGKIYRLTEDHSAVMEMVKLGIITLEEARTHEDKNVILRALGTAPEVEVATLEPFAARVGDQYLLCSDGLYDLVPDDEIERELNEATDIHAAGERLITLAKARGGHDNITIGILAIVPVGTLAAEAEAMRATREWRVQG